MKRTIPLPLFIATLMIVPVAAAHAEDPKFSGTFSQKTSPPFTEFKILSRADKAEGSAGELQLVAGKNVCRYSLSSLTESGKTVRFQGTKIDCESQRAGRVIGVVNSGETGTPGQISLIDDRSKAELNLVVEKLR